MLSRRSAVRGELRITGHLNWSTPMRCAPDPRTELTLIPTALAIVRALGADTALPRPGRERLGPCDRGVEFLDRATASLDPNE